MAAADARHRLDGGKGGFGAQGHLQHGQATGDKRLGQTFGLGGIVNDQNRNDRGKRAQRAGTFGLRLRDHGRISFGMGGNWPV